MQIKRAKNYGFCFGVRRAIELAQNHPNSKTLGPLIHNPEEIQRLKNDYNVDVAQNLLDALDGDTVIIRTHGVTQETLHSLEQSNKNIVNATCPFVTKPQEICANMSNKGYDIVIYGDIHHPEVQGVMSYSVTKTAVVLSSYELCKHRLGQKVAIISQTTRNIEGFLEIVNALVRQHKEVAVFNTICNATFDNQDAADELSKEADVMLVIGGKNSSNTKQLLEICKKNCPDSYLIETEDELEDVWFADKTLCGVTAGASTPNWIIDNVTKKLEKLNLMKGCL